MYELIIQKEYCWSAKIIMARNVGTFTLFVFISALINTYLKDFFQSHFLGKFYVI